MSNIQQTIDKRIEEKNRKAERIKESSAKGYYVKTAKYSKTPVEDIKFNCRYFIAEQTAYTGTISDLTGTVLTFDNVDSGDGGSYTATGTYYCSGFSWVTNIWAGYYLKCNGGYFRIESNTADTLTFREEIDITPASADWEIVPFISNSMYNAELNPNTGQDEVFTIKSNTDTTITVAPSGSILLTDVASATDTFEVKKYYAPRIEDFDDQGAGTIQSKIVDAPFGKLVDKNMGAHFAGVYSVRLLCFNSKSFQIKLDVPDSLRVVETQGDDENVLLDSRFGQNTANVLALNFTASVWKRLDFFYYTSRGDYGFTIEGLNDPIGNYVDAWSDVTPDAPSNVVATGYTCKIKITWVNTGLIGTGGGTQIYRSTSEGGTYTFVNFVPWDGNEYTDAGLDGETTYYYKLKSRNNRGDLSDYSSVVNATTLPEVGDPGYALRIACVSGSHSIDGNNAYYKSGDVLSITISSPVALTAAPTVTVAGEAASLASLAFEDDFEGGDFAKWDAVGSDWSVQDAVVISGDYSAQCDVTAWESEDAKLEKSGVWKNFTIEGDIRVNQKYGVCQKATIGGRSDGTGWIYYGLSMRPGDGGHFQYYDGTAFYNFPNDKTWDVDTVYHFKITYDFTNSIQYTWVDGFYLGERSMKDGHGVLLNDNRYFEKVSIFGSSGWESGHDYLYADNIEIYKTTHEYTNCIYTYTIAGTEDEGTQAIVASGTGKEGGTTISGTANIFLDFVAPTVTGTPIIISADDDLKTGDQYAYHADKIWVFTTDDLVDTSGDPAETSGLNRIYLQNAFVGTSTAVGSGYLTDSVLASIFANDYWNNYYLTDSAGTTRQIIDYVGASGQIAMIGTPAAGAYYITKYPIATITSWRNYDVSNRQVIIWNLTLDMPYTTATIPDTITLSTNHKYRVIAKITDQSLNASALCYDDIYLDQTAPGVVTGLTATGDIQSIILKFTTPGAIDLDRINIYMNTSAGIAVDNVPTNYVKMYCMADAIPNKASEFVVYFDEPEELTRYFVCTAVDKSGREGVCSSEVSAATLPHWGKLFRNYFDNGSFERLASAEVPVNWTRHGSATVEQDPQFGDNCIEINSEVNYYSYDYLWLPANPDTYFFTFSIYAKYIAPDTDADVLFDFIWYDRNGDAISKTSLGIGGGNGFYDEDDDEAMELTDSYARYHTYFGSGYNEIPSNADYVFIKIMGLEGRVAHADAVQWEETSSGGMMPTAFVNNRVDSGQRAMYKYIRGSMIEADTLTTDLIRIGAQTSIYSGTLSSTAYNSVTWATGYLKVGGETYTITGSSHASLTASTRYYLYFDKNTSTTTFQITLTQSTAYGDDKVLIAIVDTGAVFNYAASITPMHSSGTIINGSQIRTGEIASHDEKTKFDLDGDQIVINETVDRVILGKTATGKYGIKIYDASGNLIMQVDDDDQLLQSADTKSYVDLKNSEIGMNDGGGNEVIINPTEGLIGKHNSYKTFDVGATTGRAFFRGGVMSGRMSCIPLYATAFGLDKTDTGIAEIKIDDDSWDFGNGVIVGETCYLNGYIYVCISGDELTYYVPIIGKINCITNAFTWEPILSMADAGTIGGICTDGTYIWVAASVDTNDDLVEDTVKVYKISPTTLEIIASYAIDAPANLATPLEMCYDGTYLWIADFTDANHDIIYFKISDQTDGVVALTYESSCVCFDGTYIWAGEYGAKLGKIDPATKALTEYNHNGWGGVCFDGTHVWAANANVITPQVKKIDPSSPTTALATISTSAAPFRMVFDGRLMFVCCPGDAVVDVIDIFTNTKLGTDKSSAFAFYICFDGLNFWESGYGNTNYVTKIPH